MYCIYVLYVCIHLCIYVFLFVCTVYIVYVHVLKRIMISDILCMYVCMYEG